MAENAFDPSHLFGHVQDAEHFEVPKVIARDGRIEIPQPVELERPLTERVGIIEPLDLRLTKFMVLEAVAAVLLIVVFIRLASRASRDTSSRNRPNMTR